VVSAVAVAQDVVTQPAAQAMKKNFCLNQFICLRKCPVFLWLMIGRFSSKLLSSVLFD
jgi:hypothetical protein